MSEGNYYIYTYIYIYEKSGDLISLIKEERKKCIDAEREQSKIYNKFIYKRTKVLRCVHIFI